MCPDNKETPQSLIADFVLECKGKGSFLPYVDYSIIEEWIKVSQNIDELLLILSDVLPEYFNGEKASGKQLAGVNKLVLTCIKDRAMRS
jgi:hypothetical protein